MHCDKPGDHNFNEYGRRRLKVDQTKQSIEKNDQGKSKRKRRDARVVVR